MIDTSAMTAIGECFALVVGGYGSLAAKRGKRAAEQAEIQTKNTGNGFAGRVTGDLTAIRAHLAAQDMHMVAQDEQLAEVRKVIVRHDALLKTLAMPTDKD